MYGLKHIFDTFIMNSLLYRIGLFLVLLPVKYVFFMLYVWTIYSLTHLLWCGSLNQFSTLFETLVNGMLISHLIPIFILDEYPFCYLHKCWSKQNVCFVHIIIFPLYFYT